MATGISPVLAVARPKPWRRAALPSWTAQAWGAIGATGLFLAITCWWLTQDRSVPVFDAGRHLTFAFYVFDELDAGHLGSALTLTTPYPPLAYLVGDLGILFGGIGVAPPILAENFVFVPLLALGCYHVGRMAFDPTAGLLAVLFALGSPLITAQFHVFMTDAPETAMVAVSLWAILATDGFSRVSISAVAGLAVGLGLLTKEPFVFYAAGPVAVTAIRGGLKAWRGMLAFALVALAIALPWYACEFAQVQSLGSLSIGPGGATRPASAAAPARVTIENFEWYFWNMIDSQLYAPLFAFSTIGWVWAVAGFVRRRTIGRFVPELAIGAFVAWLAITETFPHDTRYSMPLLVYLAVFGVGWTTRLPRAGRVVATTALALIVASNVAGSSFGVGSPVSVSLNSSSSLTLYSSGGFLVSGPQRDGDMLATLEALKRAGVSTIALEGSTPTDAAFSAAGMRALDQVVGLTTMVSGSVWEHYWLAPPIPAESYTEQYADVHNGPAEPGLAAPCVRLANDTGVWIRLGNPSAPGARYYCPSRRPRFYGR
jgi:Dolichyl-phosphate-mannose-protein mannosyltransferase